MYSNIIEHGRRWFLIRFLTPTRLFHTVRMPTDTFTLDDWFQQSGSQVYPDILVVIKAVRYPANSGSDQVYITGPSSSPGPAHQLSGPLQLLAGGDDSLTRCAEDLQHP
jgi:hypothetical protein